MANRVGSKLEVMSSEITKEGEQSFPCSFPRSFLRSSAKAASIFFLQLFSAKGSTTSTEVSMSLSQLLLQGSRVKIPVILELDFSYRPR